MIDQVVSTLLDAMVRMLACRTSTTVIFPDPAGGYARLDDYRAPLSCLDSLAVVPSSKQLIGDIWQLMAPEFHEYVNGYKLSGEDYCILRCLSLLRTDGRLAIFLGDDILTSCQKQRLRELILRFAHLEAVVSFARARGSIVVLRRKGGTDVRKHVETLFLMSFMVAEPRDIGLVLAHLSAHDISSEVRRRTNTAIIEMYDGGSWLPRARLADRDFRSAIPDCVPLSHYIKLVDRPRDLKAERPSYFADNTEDGIEPSADSLRAFPRDAFVRYYNVVEDGDLLLTRQVRRIVGNVASIEHDGLVVRSSSQTYESSELQYDRLSTRLIALLFQSDKYSRYLFRRLSRTAWKTDVPNLLVPQLKNWPINRLLVAAEATENEIRSLTASIRRALSEISRIYRKELGVGPLRMSLLARMPVVRMSEMLSRDSFSRSSQSSSAILKNLNVDVGQFEPEFLEGYLISDLVPEQIRNYSRDIFVPRYMELLSRNVWLPLVPKDVQRMVLERACHLVGDFKRLTFQRAELLESNPMKQIVDGEVLDAYNPR